MPDNPARMAGPYLPKQRLLRDYVAMHWIDSLLSWARENESIVWWALASCAALFITAPIVVAGVLVGLPSDYFSTQRRPLESLSHKPVLRIALLIVKNLLGTILLIAGVAMLMLPGQGLLTIIVGVALLDFPGKFQLQRWLITRPKMKRTINWLRRRAGRAALT
jgi:hypothetical protein